MRTIRPLFILFVFVAGGGLLAGGGEARADRYQRGLALYQSRCTDCHSTGWKVPGPPEHGRLDLTRVVDRQSEASLRQWLLDPVAQKRDTACRHVGLTREQVDDLIAFFRIRAQTPPSPTRGGGGAVTPPRRPDNQLRRNGR